MIDNNSIIVWRKRENYDQSNDKRTTSERQANDKRTTSERQANDKRTTSERQANDNNDAERIEGAN